MASLTIRDIEDSIKDEIKDRKIDYIFPYDTGEKPAICIELSCGNESEGMR